MSAWGGWHAGPGDHEVWVDTGIATGTVATLIGRYAVIRSAVGTAITYADDVAAGAAFTIHANGIYAVTVGDSTAYDFGASVNSIELTTSIMALVNPAARIVHFGASTVVNYTPKNRTATGLANLSAGDIVRPHRGVAMMGATDRDFIRIRKVASL